MHALTRALVCGSVTVCAACAHAQTAPPPGGNALNPNISVIGWLQGTAGNDDAVSDPAAILKEAEVAVQSVVDPYSRADVFISFHDDEAPELEEAYLTLVSLPAGFQARLGKFRDAFGKFNLTHPGETPFADRPLAAAAFLGLDGLASTGLEASWLAPLPVYTQVTGAVQRAPEESRVFGPGESRGDLLWSGRAAAYADITDNWNLWLDASLARGPLSDAHATLSGASVVVRWKNRRQAIYRSLVWHTEAYHANRAPDTPERGGFSFVDYQFARRWHAGARGDIVSYRDASDERGALAFLTFTPTEFSLVSAQTRRVRYSDTRSATQAFLKITFNIGPHGAHPF